MNRNLLFVIGISLACGAAQSSMATPVSAADRQALERLAAANDAAWGAKDVETISAQYAPDGSVRVSPQSAVVSGREPVTGFFRQAFSRRQGTHRHITTLDHIELVAPDMALADASVRVERQDNDGRWSLVRTFRNVSLAVRDKGQWKLRSVRAIPQN